MDLQLNEIPFLDQEVVAPADQIQLTSVPPWLSTDADVNGHPSGSLADAAESVLRTHNETAGGVGTGASAQVSVPGGASYKKSTPVRATSLSAGQRIAHVGMLAVLFLCFGYLVYYYCSGIPANTAKSASTAVKNENRRVTSEDATARHFYYQAGRIVTSRRSYIREQSVYTSSPATSAIQIWQIVGTSWRMPNGSQGNVVQHWNL